MWYVGIPLSVLLVSRRKGRQWPRPLVSSHPAACSLFHFHSARVGFKTDSEKRGCMAVQQFAPRDDTTAERRIDVTGLPAGALRDFAETTDGDVFLERKKGTFVVTTE